MICPECSATIPADSTFCPECRAGIPQKSETLTEGIHLSEKSTVVGDVVGGDRIDIKTHGGQAHFHTHKDPTKNIATCWVCGNEEKRLGGFVCPECKNWCCSGCYDKTFRQCEKCLQANKAKRVEEYNALLQEVYEDGLVEAHEAEAMEKTAERLGLTEDEVAELKASFQASQSISNDLGRLELMDFSKAEQLLLNEFDPKGALHKIERLYIKYGKTNGRIRKIYLLALLEIYPEKALKIASSFHDDPEVTLMQIEGMCRIKDFHGAEEVRKRAAGLFPTDVRLRVIEAEIMLDGYFQSNNEAYVDAAREILGQCEGEGDNDEYVFFVRTYLNQFEDENALVRGREELIKAGLHTFYFDRKSPQKESRFSQSIKEWESASESNRVVEWLKEKANDPTTMNDWLRGAKMSDSGAQFLLGEYLYQKAEEEGGNLEESVTWWQKSAEQGQKQAQYLLAWSYRVGTGVDADHAKAFHWFNQAADQGNADAQYWLACCYRDGCGTVANLVNARKWFKKAVESGHKGAANDLRDLDHN